MKTLKTILLIAGIILLAAGVWKQDLGPSTGVVVAFNVIVWTEGAPSWHDLAVADAVVEKSARTGMTLKLIAFAILFSLFFWQLYEGGRGVSAASMLGLGSAVCFALFTIAFPALRIVQWLIRSLVVRIPDSLDAQGVEQLRNAIFNQGYSAPMGVLFLAIALFLLAAALMAHRHRMVGAIHIPALTPGVFMLTQEGRAGRPERVITWFEILLQGGIFSIAVYILPIAFLAVFIWGLVIRNKKPHKTSLLATGLFLVTGFVTAAHWLLLRPNIAHIRSVFESVEFASPAELAGSIQEILLSTFAVSFLLIACSVLLPVLCAFSLRVPRDKEKKGEKAGKSLFPLIAAGATIIILVFAGFLGSSEDPHKKSVKELALAVAEGHLGREKDEHVARIESEGGFRFLRGMMANPREFYWNQLILEYLWEYSASPKAKEFVLETFTDSAHPIAAAQASFGIRDSLTDNEKRVVDLILSHISREPKHGIKFLETALRATNIRSRFILDVMDTCARAGVKEFSLHKRKKQENEWSWILDLPEGFTLHYNREPEPGARKFSVELRWVEKTSYQATQTEAAHYL